MLGVRSDLLATFGAVSRETVLAMAEGLLERTPADLVVATTGLAGPEGDGSATPIGRVWLAGAIRGRPVRTVAGNFSGGRAEVRAQAAEAAWRLAAEILDTV
jgi:nicotinamide-nucleotide amidase